jgi:hypothetical protein
MIIEKQRIKNDVQHVKGKKYEKNKGDMHSM